MNRQSVLLISLAMLLALLTHDAHAAMHDPGEPHTRDIPALHHAHPATPDTQDVPHANLHDRLPDVLVEVCTVDDLSEPVVVTNPLWFNVAVVPSWPAPLAGLVTQAPSFDEPVYPPSVRRAMLQVYLN